MKRLAILGSTGSIGASTLDVVEHHPGRFEVVALAAARSVETLARQIKRHRPKLAAVLDAKAAAALKELLPTGTPTRVVFGGEGYLAAVVESGADVVLSAMVGFAGLMPTFAGVKAGLTIALANKEVLVAGGELVTAAARESGSKILPVDSEHSAIFQSLMGHDPAEVANLWLTASGGPFREKSKADLAKVTREQALDHPNWSMGPKITIDSSTLMNKGLEVIEAHWLFNQPFDSIKVVIHPQSVVHSMVEYIDGSVIAQMGAPDMRLPIAFALGHPHRLEVDARPLAITSMGPLTFQEPDLDRFPALALAYQAGRAGGAAPAVLNAANEVAVAAFLAGKIDYLSIVSCVERVLDRHMGGPAASVAQVLEADRWARGEATRILAQG